MKRVWLVGPISWDTVIEIDSYPINGGFAQGNNRKERPGGSAANTAIALASTGVETNLISFVGDDELGIKLLENLKQVPGLKAHVPTLAGASLHAIVTIDKSGERTVFALEENRLNQIAFDFSFDADDILCFPVWRDFYSPWLERGRNQGAFTVVGLSRLMNNQVKAELAVASEKDIEDQEFDFTRFSKIILTRGALGSVLLDGQSQINVPAVPAKVKDATGAGDSYLAGLLFAIAGDTELNRAMELGSKWAAATVELESSIPPTWSEVCRRFGL